MEKLDSLWTDFLEIWYLRIFRKKVGKIQVSLESDMNSGYFTYRPMYSYVKIPLDSSQNEKCC